ncbi:hypothetical protein ABT009_16000 [Streptomyces sp. NPDC002896]|uniref:hypothetical protein n=1 Tax=Streptomyces sp. NPDC002896 TaxID=3154438 RepID=UPI00332B8321
MATRKTTARKRPSKTCPICKGTGEVAVSVRIGRKRRVVGQQNGLCLTCFGTGLAPTD